VKPLVPPHVLTQVRLVAEQGMQTMVTIRRRSVVVSDYGDDSVEFTETHETMDHGVKGWFYSTPTPVQEVNAGALVTVNTYRLYVPVGTDVVPGDEVLVGDDGVYIVSDTTAESTWLAMLECSLRKRD
jgi:hypothetical protein